MRQVLLAGLLKPAWSSSTWTSNARMDQVVRPGSLTQAWSSSHQFITGHSQLNLTASTVSWLSMRTGISLHEWNHQTVLPNMANVFVKVMGNNTMLFRAMLSLVGKLFVRRHVHEVNVYGSHVYIHVY
jgi:hypothetical protein